MSEKNNNERKALKASKEERDAEFSTYNSVPGPAVLHSVSMPNFGYLLNERRFQAACAAMQGLLASEEGNVVVSQALMDNIAKVSVEYADTLLAELAKVEK